MPSNIQTAVSAIDRQINKIAPKRERLQAELSELDKEILALRSARQALTGENGNAISAAAAVSLKQRVHDYIAQQPNGVTVQEISNLFGSTARQYLTTGTQTGIYLRVGEGQYRLRKADEEAHKGQEISA